MTDDDLDLSAVAADAALLDALAAGSAGALDEVADDDAFAGLAALRAALDEDLLLDRPLVPRQAAPVGDVVALRRPTGRRAGGRAAVLIAGAALAVSSTGVAAATYEARPGDAFYDLRTTVAGPRAEDPDLLRERLDAVQQQLRAPDAATRSSARDELAEVGALLSELPPGMRGELAQRHALLLERLAESAPGAPPSDRPVGPPAGVPTGPPTAPPGRPTDKPSPERSPQSRPEPTRAPESAPPAQEQPSPQETTRPSPRDSASPRTQSPSPRRTQAAPPLRAPRAGQPAVVGKPGPAPTRDLTPPG